MASVVRFVTCSRSTRRPAEEGYSMRGPATDLGRVPVSRAGRCIESQITIIKLERNSRLPKSAPPTRKPSSCRYCVGMPSVRCMFQVARTTQGRSTLYIRILRYVDPGWLHDARGKLLVSANRRDASVHLRTSKQHSRDQCDLEIPRFRERSKNSRFCMTIHACS